VTPADLSAVTVEVQVLDCAPSRSHYGPWVKLAFTDPEHARHFRKGQRLVIAAVLMHDEEAVETRKPIEQRRAYKPSQLAGMMAHNRDWWRFVHDKYGHLSESPEAAAEWQREACGVKSRAELDSNRVARELWLRLLAEFDEWRGHD
jgi:hypothetical protein